MKKFTFSLQKLLSYKEQVFDNELLVLSEMRGVLARMEQEKASLEQEHRERADQFSLLITQGTTAQELELHKMYLGVVDRSIRQKINQIALQRQAIDKQTDKVREAKIEISTLEKLRERKLEEYTYQENKQQEQFIEEFVSTQKAMALIMGDAG